MFEEMRLCKCAPLRLWLLLALSAAPGSGRMGDVACEHGVSACDEAGQCVCLKQPSVLPWPGSFPLGRWAAKVTPRLARANTWRNSQEYVTE